MADEVTVDVRGAATFRRFTRRVVRVEAGPTGDRVTEELDIPVVEVVPDAEHPDRFVRLYLTAAGPILSNEDRIF